jgi:hypothetical protein
MKARASVLAFLLAGGVWAQSVVAQTPGGESEVQRFDRDKLWAYAGCAASVALAGTTQQWWVAAFGCMRVIDEFWTK